LKLVSPNSVSSTTFSSTGFLNVILIVPLYCANVSTSAWAGETRNVRDVVTPEVAAPSSGTAVPLGPFSRISMFWNCVYVTVIVSASSSVSGLAGLTYIS